VSRTPTLCRAMLTVIALLAMSPLRAAEGMWTLDELPQAQMQARYGFTASPAWTKKVLQASLRLAGGCSASFVSADGLVMTNHHCAVRCVEQLSTPQNDRVAQGFLARERSQELPCPEIELNRLDSISDVTGAMQAATAGRQGAAFQAAEDAERARLTRECRGADAETVRCDLVVLYRGGRYQLYKYHRYSDVRLVWAPEQSIASFGGDLDNFNFPRYDLDAIFLRAYEGGQPARAAEHFRFKPAGAEAGELVFVTGHPGATQRSLTVAQLEALRDNLALNGLPGLSELRGVLLQYARQGPEAARLAATALPGTENALKVSRGRLQALSDPALLAAKRSDEAALRAFVAARPALAASVRDPWADIAQAQVARRTLELEHGQLEEGRAFSGTHFQAARTLVRGTAERAKPNGQRLREYTDNALPQIEQRLRSSAPVYPAFEVTRLAWSLGRMRSLLGADSALVRQVLGTRTPEQVAQALVDGSRLGTAAERLRLWQGGQAAVDASDDPFIQLVRALEPAARALRARFEAEVLAVEREAGQRIALARFAQAEPGSYPDATFTLRLSYGEVRGWEERGRTVPPFTDLAGLFGRATGAPPFALPASWLAARGRLNPAQRFNFVATHDIIGGNSGSPILNRDAEVVGLAFDGNLPSLGGAYAYDERLNRSVGVHSGAIVEALRTVYGADALLAELLGVP